jgi:hypothetical protein
MFPIIVFLTLVIVIIILFIWVFSLEKKNSSLEKENNQKKDKKEKEKEVSLLSFLFFKILQTEKGLVTGEFQVLCPDGSSSYKSSYKKFNRRFAKKMTVLFLKNRETIEVLYLPTFIEGEEEGELCPFWTSEFSTSCGTFTPFPDEDGDSFPTSVAKRK